MASVNGPTTIRLLAKFEAGLVEAKAKGWTVVDMKNEWKIIYPFEKK